MKTTNLYPYQNIFINYCRKIQKLSEYSINMINSNLSNFWIYFSANMPNDPNINNVTSSNIRDYLIQLDQKEHLSKKTINKYLSYLKKYFIFLTENHLISNYPLYNVKGISFKRRETIIINWMPYINNFLGKELHPETIKLLILISQGYDLDQLLNVRWDDINSKLSNTLKRYLINNLDFTKTSNPYIYQGKRIDKYTSLDRVTSVVKKDQQLIAFPTTPRKLRQSYILSIVSNPRLSDSQILKILRISKNSLSYYKFCINYYNLIPYKDYAWC
ncbi:site-specific integrase [Lactobacillus amylovorus]|uniref:site-specific integrase n=1 Tax=Lactobacillus amylovorus TaxID=1604 RepID=UPI003F890975